ADLHKAKTGWRQLKIRRAIDHLLCPRLAIWRLSHRVDKTLCLRFVTQIERDNRRWRLRRREPVGDDTELRPERAVKVIRGQSLRREIVKVSLQHFQHTALIERRIRHFE